MKKTYENGIQTGLHIAARYMESFGRRWRAKQHLVRKNSKEWMQYGARAVTYEDRAAVILEMVNNKGLRKVYIGNE